MSTTTPSQKSTVESIPKSASLVGIDDEAIDEQLGLHIDGGVD